MAKRRFRMSRLFLTGLMLIGGGALAGLAYLQHPLFGKLPDGERLARIRESGNQVDGTFRNQIETPLLTTDETQLELWLGNFNKQNSTHPPAEIPVIRTDLKALDLTQDLVVWLGHSSYFVQLGGQRILIDPVFSANAAPVMRANVAFEGTNVYGVDDVPEIDMLLISHDHYDHLDYPTVTALQPGSGRPSWG
ncbi:metal-dependent hydrolase [Raoultella terrigena]|uniref:MBL fold metallo-hydrolase n=1 Tax=Raoultella terrigena TaxID=577 RepID=UPI000DFC4FF1|nr:MBL fold metallo-hydrolase [Raoultella terrigena]SUQ57213.1 metal-dependent hydrolase [Raoultella terrigena]